MMEWITRPWRAVKEELASMRDERERVSLGKMVDQIEQKSFLLDDYQADVLARTVRAWRRDGAFWRVEAPGDHGRVSPVERHAPGIDL